MTKFLSVAEFEDATPRSRAEPVAIWKTRKYIEKRSGRRAFPPEGGERGQYYIQIIKLKNFKQVTGIKFVEYVARTRFEKACRLLHDDDLRISDIAFAVGFQSLSQFNRVFKRLSGKSPTQYRAAKRCRRRR